MSKQTVMYLYNGTLFSSTNEPLKHIKTYMKQKIIMWSEIAKYINFLKYNICCCYC